MHPYFDQDTVSPTSRLQEPRFAPMGAHGLHTYAWSGLGFGAEWAVVSLQTCCLCPHWQIDQVDKLYREATAR